MTFPLECLDKASLKHKIHMLKDMLKLANNEIINLWSSFVFLKTTRPTFRYQGNNSGFLFIMTRTGTNFQHCCIKSSREISAQSRWAAIFSTDEITKKDGRKTPFKHMMKVTSRYFHMHKNSITVEVHHKSSCNHYGSLMENWLCINADFTYTATFTFGKGEPSGKAWW